MRKLSFSLFLFFLLAPSAIAAALPNYDACPNPNLGKASLYKVVQPAYAKRLNSRPKPCVKNRKCSWSQRSYLKGGELVLAHFYKDFEKLHQTYDFYCVYYAVGKRVYSGFIPAPALAPVKDPQVSTAGLEGQWESQHNATLGLHFNGVNFDLLGNAFDVVNPDAPEHLNFVGSGYQLENGQVEGVPQDLTQECRLKLTLRGSFLFATGNGKCNGERAQLTGTFHKIGPAPQALAPRFK